jgi:hypothetical protein
MLNTTARQSMRTRVARDVTAGVLCLAAVIAVAYPNIIFRGETLVAT